MAASADRSRAIDGIDSFADFAEAFLRLVPEATAEHGELTEDFAPEEPPLTTWMSRMGRVLADHWASIQGGDRAPAIFDLVEEGMSRGSERLSTAIATGLIEALASASSGGRIDQAELEAVLGPESLEYLRAWDAFSLRGEF